MPDKPEESYSGSVTPDAAGTNISTNISTNGGDYAEGNIDKRKGTFIEAVRNNFITVLAVVTPQQELATELPHEQRRVIVFFVATTVISLLTGIATNIATETFSGANQFILRVAWIILLLCGVCSIGLAIWRSRLDRAHPIVTGVEALRKKALIFAQRQVEYRLRSSLTYPKLSLRYVPAPELINSQGSIGAKREELPCDCLHKLIKQEPFGLLVAGAPGCGKTVVLATLAEKMCQEALVDAQCRVPLIIDLAAWRPSDRNLDDWLAGQVQHICHVSLTHARTLIRTGKVRPLLDGLDNVPLTHHAAVVKAINNFVQELSSDLIVTARMDTIKQLPPLEVANAVRIQPLSKKDLVQAINSYGQLYHPTDYRAKLAPIVELIRSDATIRDLIRTPLMLYLLLQRAATSRAQTAAPLPPEGNISPQYYLVEHYLTYMLTPSQRQSATFRPEVIRPRLNWIATRLVQESATVFSIEAMQPHWLPKARDRSFYMLWVGVATGIVFALIALFGRWLAVTIAAGLMLSNRRGADTRLVRAIPRLLLVLITVLLMSGLFIPVVAHVIGIERCNAGFVVCWDSAATFGLLGGLIFGFIASPYLEPPRIQPIRRIVWSWPTAKAGLAIGFGLGLTVTLPLVTGLWLWFGSALASEFDNTLTSETVMIGALGWACAIGLILALLLCVVHGIVVEADSGRPTIPNEGIIRSIAYALFAAIVVGPVTWLFLHGLFGAAIMLQERPALKIFADPLVKMLTVLLRNLLLPNLGVPLSFGLSLGLGLGGFVAIQHAILRVQLWRRHLLPLNAARFLNYLAGRQVLSREGGGYTFVPAWLREYLAK